MHTRSILALLIAVGCSRSSDADRVAPAVRGGAGLEGAWTLALLGPPPTTRPPVLNLTVDSVVDGTVFGAVVSYMAGDAGSDASDFRPVEGSGGGDSWSLSVRHRGTGDVVFLFAGTLSGDTLALAEFRIAGSDLTDGGIRRWALIRRRRP